jgi:Eukaryotic aspartyl protease
MFSTRLTTDNGSDSSIMFGGLDMSKFNSPMRFSPVTYSESDWILNTTGITVNGKSSKLLGQSIPVLFDTGTPNLMFNKSITEVKPKEL